MRREGDKDSQPGGEGELVRQAEWHIRFLERLQRAGEVARLPRGAGEVTGDTPGDWHGWTYHVSRCNLTQIISSSRWEGSMGGFYLLTATSQF